MISYHVVQEFSNVALRRFSSPMLTADAQQYLDLRTVPTPPYFAPYLQRNPFFGTGNSFAPPRRLYLAAVVEF